MAEPAAPFEIADLALFGGRLGICPIPGRSGDFETDFEALVTWQPTLVITMTSTEELKAVDAGSLPDRLEVLQISWVHLPTPDFGVMSQTEADRWPDVSKRCLEVLKAGGRVLVHCHGGCGRSGMICLRLMREAGMPNALSVLRALRPCAVETEAQMAWAQQKRSPQ